MRFLIALIGIYLFIERSGSLSIIGILLTVLNVFIYGTISSILLAVLLLNEELAPIQWVGSFLVVFSVALVSVRPGINKLTPFMRRMNILINP